MILKVMFPAIKTSKLCEQNFEMPDKSKCMQKVYYLTFQPSLLISDSPEHGTLKYSILHRKVYKWNVTEGISHLNIPS